MRLECRGPCQTQGDRVTARRDGRFGRAYWNKRSPSSLVQIRARPRSRLALQKAQTLAQATKPGWLFYGRVRTDFFWVCRQSGRYGTRTAFTVSRRLRRCRFESYHTHRRSPGWAARGLPALGRVIIWRIYERIHRHAGPRQNSRRMRELKK